MHRDQFNKTCVKYRGDLGEIISERVREDFLTVMKLNVGFEG